MGGTPKKWKKPDEVMKIQLAKRRQRQLQARLLQSPLKDQTNRTPEKSGGGKRKNPFSRNLTPKKRKSEDLEAFNPDDTMFQLLHTTPIEAPPNVSNPVFVKFKLEEEEEAETVEENEPCPHLPFDWSLKSRIRFLSPTTIPGNNLKTNQEASGLTGFVRCIDLEGSNSSNLDNSAGARIYQGSLYWQHPNLPWLTLYPRNSRNNHGFQVGAAESEALCREWADSFRSLFQLVRTRQCPFFYVCANAFTVLFRAAGIGGRAETHAFLTPTTRGMRSALKTEDIDFTMPLKPVNLSKTRSPNTSNSNLSDDVSSASLNATEEAEVTDDEDDEAWLESLGVDAEQIKKINENSHRKRANAECEGDFSDQSLALIEGANCQALFNFLLNSKSTVGKVGRLANVPPTLLAPVAFRGASLKSLTSKTSKIRYDGRDFSSMELRGVVLPHILPYFVDLLSGSRDCFSATLTAVPSTLAFTKASEKVLEGSKADAIFGRENLSDCGVAPGIVEAMCRVGPEAVRPLEQVKYVKEDGRKGYLF